MKITELLESIRAARIVEAPQPPRRGSALPTAPRAASIDDVEDDGEDDEGPLDSEREFKTDAVSIGESIYALSAWVYPEAWSGDGYSDMLMHRITSLANELDADIGDYEGINEQSIADDRRLEIVFYNELTKMMFRLSASGAQGSGSVEFTPSLADLQHSGMVTNVQLPKLRNIENIVRAWCDAVPESAEVDDAGGRPNTRSWKRAEDAVTKLFAFTDPGIGGDDAASDPDSSEFWSGSNVYQEPSPEGKKRGEEFMQKWREEMRAKMVAKAAKKNAGPGRDKRK